MKAGLISFFLFFLPWLVSGQQPVITCLNVKDNGDVEIFWQPYSGGNFEKYAVFYAPDGITYTNIYSTNDINTTSYLHVGAMADGDSRYYKLKVYSAGDSATSEVLHTIFLFLDPSQAGQANLSWNPPNTSSDNHYKIWRKLTPGNWEVIVPDQTGTFHKDIIEDGVCDTYINYKIELITPYNCSYNSNMQGAVFTESNYPANPVFDSVSINYFNGTPRVVLGWEPSISQDVAGYIVYRFTDVFISIDTVYNTTFFVDTTVQACDTVYTYALASLDQCGNTSPGTFSTPLSNIHLVEVTYDPCKLEATITFEPFVDLDADSIHFDLIGNSSPGGKNSAYSFVKPVTAGILPREMAQYITVVDEDLRFGRTYDYFIMETVYKNGNYYTTSTCIRSIYTYNYARPDHIYFANADVLPDNRIELTIDYDPDVKKSHLKLWRSDPGEDTYMPFKTVYVDTLSGWPLVFTDDSADGSLGYYHYRIDVLDSCRNVWLESNEVKTMFLKVTVKDKNHNLLQWNRFEDWDEHVGVYYIYRLEDEASPWVPVDSVGWYADNYEYTDDISSISGAVEHLVYWVEAVERVEDGFGFKEQSNSNRVVVTPESDIYFPNAFKPGSELNRVFKPVFRFLGGTGYLFQVYNRWGQLIYETRDVSAGWDGTYKGNYVEQGTYIYKFQYMDGFGNAVNRQGTVTVIY